jgi:hypothetical protein
VQSGKAAKIFKGEQAALTRKQSGNAARKAAKAALPAKASLCLDGVRVSYLQTICAKRQSR